MKDIYIDKRAIGDDHPPYIIAELSANHNGSLQLALDTITAAKKSGADAIKLQTYSADTMTLNCDLPDFQIKGGLWDGYNLYQLYQEAQTPFSWHKAMFDHARALEITCFSTPFDETSVDLLEDLNTPAYKVASFEATDLPLIRYIASTGKPIIMSTGIADLTEISEAVQAARDGGCTDLILLHCISSYPAPIDQFNLKTLPDLREKFGVHTGLSDHSLSHTAALVATSIGATVIEKHFILNRSNKGPDSEFSIEPDELTELSKLTKAAFTSLGKASYHRKPAEEYNARFRRSVYFARDMKAGETVSPGDIRRVRPGFGLPPKFENELIGKQLKQDVAFGTPTRWELFHE